MGWVTSPHNPKNKRRSVDMDINELRVRHMIRALADCAVETSSKAMQDMIKHLFDARINNGVNEKCDIFLAEAMCSLMKHTVETVLTSEKFQDIRNIPNIPEESVQLASTVLEIAADRFSEEYIGFVKAKDLTTLEDHIRALKAVEIYLTVKDYPGFCEYVYNKLREKEHE